MRLFFAVELPRALRDDLEHLQSLLRPTPADVRWVDPDGAHFTLAFLGTVDANEIRAIDDAVAPVAARSTPLCLRLRGLGTFPPQRRPRVVWIGVGGRDRERLATLHVELAEALETVGFEPERRRYRPHVTLGRVRGARGGDALAALVRQHRATDLGELHATRFVLMQSHLARDGARYQVVGSYSLGATAQTTP